MGYIKSNGGGKRASKVLSGKLKNAGIPVSFFKKVLLPSWWDDSCDYDAGCVQMLCARFAGILGVDYAGIKALLINEENEIQLPQCRTSLKTSRKKKQEVLPTVAVCEKIAAVLSSSLAQDLPIFNFPQIEGDDRSAVTGQKIREEILQNVSYVDFDSLLAYCWEKGVIVVHFAGISGAKIDGAAIPKENNPVIILGSGKKGAWNIFHLAHELGHIVLGHGEANFCAEIVEDDADVLEKEANDFAVTLLMGKGVEIPCIPVSSPKTMMSKIKVWGRSHRVAPESLALFIIHKFYKNQYSLANSMLEEKWDPHDVVNQRLRDALKVADISDSDEEFIKSVLSYLGK